MCWEREGRLESHLSQHFCISGFAAAQSFVLGRLLRQKRKVGLELKANCFFTPSNFCENTIFNGK